jgi:hypothetical protein
MIEQHENARRWLYKWLEREGLRSDQIDRHVLERVLHEAFAVPKHVGADAVVEASALAKRAPAKRTRTQLGPAEQAAIALWPGGKPPPGMSRDNEHADMIAWLKVHYPDLKVSATTLDRATGRRKDRPRKPEQ